MKDFTKPFTLENKPIQLEFNIPNMPKAGFITARINKDNFWNLMFWIIPTVIIFLVQGLSDLGGNILLFMSIIVSPYLTSRLNSVEYKNNEFHSSATNKKLGQYAPKYLGFILWCAIPFTAFWVLWLHSKMRQLDENFAVYNLIFWFIPVVYCIFQNLPISIIFNKATWTKDDNIEYHNPGSYNYSTDSRRVMSSAMTGYSYSSSSRATSYHSVGHSSSSSRSGTSYSKESIITSPIHRSFSSNIHHRK